MGDPLPSLGEKIRICTISIIRAIPEKAIAVCELQDALWGRWRRGQGSKKTAMLLQGAGIFDAPWGIKVWH
jgi:hypothetical protein